MIAFLKKSGPSFGMSEKSMSSSRIASMRFQSVLEGLFVFFPFFIVCPSQRNDANRFWSGLRENDRSRALTNLADPSPTHVSVIFPRVRFYNQEAAKHLFGVCKIEAMLAHVGAVLGLIPFEIHCNSKCSYASKALHRALYLPLIIRSLRDSW